MPKKVFVAPGYGLKPDPNHPGKMIFDPGAVGRAGAKEFVEHDLNTKVANALAAALRRCGVEVVLEQNGPGYSKCRPKSATSSSVWVARSGSRR
jgi:N-acetylmuramoyl-L-alanine amidase